MTGKRLGRQLKSIFGDEAVVDRLRQCGEALAKVTDSPSLVEFNTFIESLPLFFQSIDMYYDQLDDRAALSQKNLEMSSQELADNNARLVQLNRLFETMVDSLGQGFFLFDRDGFCLSTYSKACETLLDCSPAGLHVSEALAIPSEKRATFTEWVQLLFEELIDFDDLVAVGPKSFPSHVGKIVSLEYKPVRNTDGRLEMVVVIATDRTAETRAREAAVKMQSFATLMVNILKDKNRFRRFVAAARQIFKETYAALNREDFTFDHLAQVKRHLHTLKGAAGSFGAHQVNEAIHSLENKLNSENDIKVLKSHLTKAVPEIDHAFESMLDEHREIISEFLVEKIPSRTVPISTLEEFGHRIEALGPTAARLHRDFIDEVVAVPLRRVFVEFDPVIQQIAGKLGKRVGPIRFIGDEVSVVPESIDQFRASLVHVFRNMVDHGIEHEIIRDQRGKPPAGQVVVEFRKLVNSRGPYLRIIISDDGNGIDIWQIRTKMEKSGENVSSLTSQQLMGKIFDAGFSTASAVTEFSGRGVGLDAVKTEVERLGGSITVRSDLGRGSAFVIELPFDETGSIPKFSSVSSAA